MWTPIFSKLKQIKKFIYNPQIPTSVNSAQSDVNEDSFLYIFPYTKHTHRHCKCQHIKTEIIQTLENILFWKGLIGFKTI